MKKHYIILVFLTIISITEKSFGQRIFYDSLWKETNEQNAIYYRIIDTIIKNDYLVKDFYFNDTLQMEGHFSSIHKDKKEGNFVWYYSNGKKSTERNYKSGKLNGVYKRWYENGQQELLGFYKNNKRDSTWTWWYDNGNLWVEKDYKDDKVDGFWITYHIDGKKKDLYGFTADKFNGIAKGWDSTGILLGEINLDSELKNGSILINYPNGNTRAKGQIKNKRPEGEWLMYYENGNLNIKGSAENGYKVGMWFYYKENGEIEVFKIYSKKDKQKFKIDPKEIQKLFNGS